ncbi:MAG: low molecular weight protein arginine phosphatase [bacterium]|nr:low molecular weight protein arginine phosphatase [bacterium]
MNDGFNILFVCSGNACRSPMAEGLLKKKLYPDYRKKLTVLSAGTLGLQGNPPTANAITVAREKGVDISQHRSRGVNQQILERSDLILVMASHHRDYIIEKFPSFKNRVFLLKSYAAEGEPIENVAISDPIGENLSFYRTIINQIERELDRILPAIKTKIDHKLQNMG